MFIYYYISNTIICLHFRSADPNQSLGKMGPRVDKNLSVLEVLDSFNFDKLEMISDQDCLQKLYEKLFKTSSSASSSSPASSGGHRYFYNFSKFQKFFLKKSSHKTREMR